MPHRASLYFYDKRRRVGRKVVWDFREAEILNVHMPWSARLLEVSDQGIYIGSECSKPFATTLDKHFPFVPVNPKRLAMRLTRRYRSG